MQPYVLFLYLIAYSSCCCHANMFEDLFSGINVNELAEKVSSVVEIVKEQSSNTGEIVSQHLATIENEAAGKVSDVVEFIKEQSPIAGEFVSQHVAIIGNEAKGKVLNAVEFIKEQSPIAGEIVSQHITTIGNEAVEKVSDIVEFIKEQSPIAGEIVSQHITTIGNEAVEKVSDVVEFIKEQSPIAGEIISQHIATIGNEAVGKVSDVVEFIKEQSPSIVQKHGPVIIGSLVATVAGPPVALAVVHSMGFGATGVVANTFAAWTMRKFGTNIIVSSLQAFGASGPGPATCIAFSWIGSSVGYLVRDLSENEENNETSSDEKQLVVHHLDYLDSCYLI